MHHNNRIYHYDGTLNKTHIILFIFLSLTILRGKSNLFFGTPKEHISYYVSTSTSNNDSYGGVLVVVVVVDAFLVGTTSSSNFSMGRKRGECNPALPRKYPERLILLDKSYSTPFSCLHASSSTTSTTSTSSDSTTCEQAANTATNRKNNNGDLHDSKKFQSIRESAIVVEWEPVTELERRVDEGIFYQTHQQLLVQQERHFSSNCDVEEEGECSLCDHDAEHQCDTDDYCTCSCRGAWRWGKSSTGRNVGTTKCPNDIPRVVGVFCGYTWTKEEKSRLKSAHPKENVCSAIDDHDMWVI
jgi:hypothetical protein